MVTKHCKLYSIVVNFFRYCDDPIPHLHGGVPVQQPLQQRDGALRAVVPDSRPRWRILSPGRRVPLRAHGPSSLRPVERSSTRLVAIFNISKIRDWNIFF